MEFPHIVSFRSTDTVYWCEQATFAMHRDARHFARWLSTCLPADAVIRIESGRDYVNVYYQNGAETVGDMAEAA